jgi:hypothetical protein
MNILLQLKHKSLTTPAKSLLVLVLLVSSGIANRLFAQNWTQAVKVVASDRALYDRFGYSVSISGDYAIVGAYMEDHDLTGGKFLENAGAAYILKNDSGKWTVIQKIVAPDRAEADEFGYSVAISGDYAIVGAPRKTIKVGFDLNTYAGAAYIFKNTSGTWTQVNRLVASDRETFDEFGHSVAISGDYAIVGAPYEEHSVTGGNAQSNKGSAYIFKKGTTFWTEEQKIVGFASTDDVFGWSVGISGDYAIVGIPNDGVAASGGGILTKAGSASIFRRSASTGNWAYMQTINASDKGAGDGFGNSVAISGDCAIVGAMLEDHNATGGASLNSAGSAYIFKRNGSTWTQAKKIVAKDREASDMFGVSVSISGDYAIVGAYNEDQDQTGGNTLNNSGSAYIFKNSSGNWTQANKIVASDRGNGDMFGYSVAISEDYTIAGAYLESENTTGDNTLYSAGSAYIFKNCNVRSTDVQISCGPFKWIDGNTYTANNNTAVYNIFGGAAGGCDSLVTLNLTINGVTNRSTTTSGVTITANNTSAKYRWLDCNKNYAVIVGQTAASFTPTLNGNYAVELTQNGCLDTSDCVSILTLEVMENSFEDNIIVYPNPTMGYFTIDLGSVFRKSEIQIKDVLGNLIESTTVINKQKLDLFLNEPAGIYIVLVEADNKKAVIRILKK